MVGIIVCGHGLFASGLTSALELIMGEQENYQAVDFKKGETNTELTEKIHKAITNFEKMDNILVMSDLLSGSPFNTAVMEALKDERIKVVYGTNLGMLIETVLKRNMGENIDELLENALSTGKEQIGCFIKPEISDDEFDD